MKIIKIKGSLSKSTHEIAFVVDEPPEIDVLANVKTRLYLSFKDGYLFAQVQGDPDETPPIKSDEIQHINEAYAKAAWSKKVKLDTAEREHQQALEEIKHFTGLDVE